MKAIDSFAGAYSFLSNFYPAEVEWEGDLYPTVEHGYQAAKTDDPEERRQVHEAPDPHLAKRTGSKITMRDDWETDKLRVMEELVRQKFTRHDDLRQQLLATGQAELIEGHAWRDRFWSVYEGRGQNHLGRSLMPVRAELVAADQSERSYSEFMPIASKNQRGARVSRRPF